MVLAQMQAVLLTPEMIIATWRAAPDQGADLTEADIRAALADMAGLWGALFPAEQRRPVDLLVESATLHADHVDIRLRAEGLGSLVQELARGVAA